MKALIVATDRSGELARPLKAAGSKVSVVSSELGTNSLYRNLQMSIQILEKMRKNDFDTVIFRGTGIIGVVCIVFGVIYSVPIVSRVGGDKFREYRDHLVFGLKQRDVVSMGKAVFRTIFFLFCMVFANGVIVVSERLKQRYRVFTRVFNQTIVVIPVSINVDAKSIESNEQNEDSDEGCKTLLTVTNLDFYGKYLGVKESVEAVRSLLKLKPELEYVIAGDGRYHEELREYIDKEVQEEDIKERIQLVGHVDPVPLYKRADLFVYISHIDGYPNAILEAMTYRVPIVTNDSEGMSEQIVDHKSGIFVDPQKTKHVQDTIELLLDSEEICDLLSSNAYQLVCDRNNHQIVGESYIESIKTDLI
jgi:glycosyltransferase involved in cell wall biosynthesis